MEKEIQIYDENDNNDNIIECYKYNYCECDSDPGDVSCWCKKQSYLCKEDIQKTNEISHN